MAILLPWFHSGHRGVWSGPPFKFEVPIPQLLSVGSRWGITLTWRQLPCPRPRPLPGQSSSSDKETLVQRPGSLVPSRSRLKGHLNSSFQWTGSGLCVDSLTIPSAQTCVLHFPRGVSPNQLPVWSSLAGKILTSPISPEDTLSTTGLQSGCCISVRVDRHTCAILCLRKKEWASDWAG